MPVVYELDRPSGRVHTRCVGNVTFEEVLSHFQELASEASLPERLDVLLDLSESDSIPKSDQVRTISHELKRLQPDTAWGACAVVATNDTLFGMARMFEVFAEQYFSKSRAFRDVAEAERWLTSLGRPTS